MQEGKLIYRVVTIDELDSMIMLETLLDRLIGTETYTILENEDDWTYKICFWCTDEEMETITKLFNEEVMSDLDEEYKELLKTS